MRKCEILDYLADFSSFSENEEFHENAGIAETPIIPKEYQRFWRVDGPQNAKFRKFTKNHEFHWNLQEFRNFM